MMSLKKLWKNTGDDAKEMLNEKELAKNYCIMNFRELKNELENVNIERIEKLVEDVKLMGADDCDKFEFLKTIEENVKNDE